MKKSIILLFISLLLSPLCIKAHQPEFSTAGFSGWQTPDETSIP